VVVDVVGAIPAFMPPRIVDVLFVVSVRAVLLQTTFSVGQNIQVLTLK
jgi:hypothetical protein